MMHQWMACIMQDVSRVSLSEMRVCNQHCVCCIISWDEQHEAVWILAQYERHLSRDTSKEVPGTPWRLERSQPGRQPLASNRRARVPHSRSHNDTLPRTLRVASRPGDTEPNPPATACLAPTPRHGARTGLKDACPMQWLSSQLPLL